MEQGRSFCWACCFVQVVTAGASSEELWRTDTAVQRSRLVTERVREPLTSAAEKPIRSALNLSSCRPQDNSPGPSCSQDTHHTIAAKERLLRLLASVEATAAVCHAAISPNPRASLTWRLRNAPACQEPAHEHAGWRLTVQGLGFSELLLVPTDRAMPDSS